MRLKNIFKFSCLCTALILVVACSERKPKLMKKKIKKGPKPTLRRGADSLYTVKSTKTHNVIRAVGLIKPTQQVTILCPSRGVVSEVLVEPGARVQKGQILLNLDDRLEKQRMAELKASGKNDLKKLHRLRRKRGNLSETDQLFLQSYEKKKAEFKKLKALIETKKVVSPITGDLSMDIVQVGQLYESSAKLMDVTEMSSVWVDFSLPIKHLGLVRVGRTVKITGEAYPKMLFMGRIKFVDKEVDTVHNVVRLRAECMNPNKLLLPGMNVNLEMKGPTSQNILVPKTARFKGPGGPAVFKLTPVGRVVEGKQCFMAKKVKVKFGQPVDKDKIEVVSGVIEGDILLRKATLEYSGRRFLCKLPEALNQTKAVDMVNGKGKGPKSGITPETMIPQRMIKKTPIAVIKKPINVDIEEKVPNDKDSTPIEEKISKPVIKKEQLLKRLRPIENKLKDSPFVDTDTEAKIVKPL